MNNYGKTLLQLCIACSLHIVNGRIWLDITSGSLTYFCPRGSSVVDYAIASVELMKYIGYCVGDLTVNSDHCPLNITLSSNSTSQTNIIYINDLQGLLPMVRISLIPSLVTLPRLIPLLVWLPLMIYKQPFPNLILWLKLLSYLTRQNYYQLRIVLKNLYKFLGKL